MHFAKNFFLRLQIFLLVFLASSPIFHNCLFVVLGDYSFHVSFLSCPHSVSHFSLRIWFSYILFWPQLLPSFLFCLPWGSLSQLFWHLANRLSWISYYITFIALSWPPVQCPWRVFFLPLIPLQCFLVYLSSRALLLPPDSHVLCLLSIPILPAFPSPLFSSHESLASSGSQQVSAVSQCVIDMVCPVHVFWYHQTEQHIHFFRFYHLLCSLSCLHLKKEASF